LFIDSFLPPLRISLLLLRPSFLLTDISMTIRTDAERGREVIGRWCALAEKRLDYLTDLYETGRWRRFHTEADFLENVQEARASVETWRRLATEEAGLDNKPIDYSWLGRPKVTPQQRYSVPPQPAALRSLDGRIAELCGERGESLSSAALAFLPNEPAPSIEPDTIESIEALFESVPVALAAPKTALEDWQDMFDPAVMADRYPLLRTAL
jgi:uncharacterized repeat protein (TIGR03809 family)